MSELVIAYRIYPRISKTPAFFPDNKKKLAELCLASFGEALQGVSAKLYVILDSCPEYKEMFLRHAPHAQPEFIEVKNCGNRNTFGIQLELLLGQKSEFVYFAEDDYFYLPESIKIMTGFLRQSGGFITPYDHPDYYNLPYHNFSKKQVHYRNYRMTEQATSCLTFMTGINTLRRTKHALCSYVKGNSDYSMWPIITRHRLFALKKYRMFSLNAWRYGLFDILLGKKYFLYAPQPALATHMESTLLSPGQNWLKMFRIKSENLGI
ncbi:MAG: hypothetical protein A2096_07930 [Spirochaetes bacterium GWF1_41_5]|nr:MAG: hypothetical protein A2096_07930 [Spirochaetes bacterium GWF1_41_5]